MALRLKIQIPSLATKQAAEAVVQQVKAVVASAMPKLGALAIDRLTVEAQRTLHTTASDYVRGLQEPDSLKASEAGVVVTLVGELPQALERGFNAFDLKSKLLQHAKRFTRSGAPYVDVPFRHGASADATRLQGMPADTYAAIQQVFQEAKESGSSGRVRLRQRTPGASFTRNLRFGDKIIPTAVQHKRGLYDDMIRTASNVSSGGQYRTIRRISENSDATSWWHPGFRGVHIFDKVMPTLEPTLKTILSDSLKNAGFKIR